MIVRETCCQAWALCLLTTTLDMNNILLSWTYSCLQGKWRHKISYKKNTQRKAAKHRRGLSPCIMPLYLGSRLWRWSHNRGCQRTALPWPVDVERNLNIHRSLLKILQCCQAYLNDTRHPAITAKGIHVDQRAHNLPFSISMPNFRRNSFRARVAGTNISNKWRLE